MGENTAFIMKNNVEFYGGFAGTATSLEKRILGNEKILTTNEDYVIYNKYSENNILTSSPKLDNVTIKGAGLVVSTTTTSRERANPPTIGAYEFMADATIDTLIDVWYRENGLSGDSANPDAKPFNDGITNLEKFTFGLSANKATTYTESPNFKQIIDGNNAIFHFPINKNINLKSRTSL